VGGGTYHISVGESEAKRPLASTRSRWEYNIKADFQEMGWRHELDLIWFLTNRGRALVNAVMSLPVPENFFFFFTNLRPVSVSIRILLHGVGGS